MFHKIKQVLTKEDLIIEIEFENEIVKEYDIKKVVQKWPIFEKLKDKELFKKVKIDAGGYGISWNEDIDLSCEEIWKNAKEINKK